MFDCPSLSLYIFLAVYPKKKIRTNGKLLLYSNW